MAKPQPAAASTECRPALPTLPSKRQCLRVIKPHATISARKLDKYFESHPLLHLPKSTTRLAIAIANGKMECKIGAKKDKILARVNSIYDLDSDTVAELRGTLAGRFSIDKFPVDMWDWQEWSKKHSEISGIEYDAQNSRIRIKATPSPLHAAATAVIGEWLLGVRDRLVKTTGNKFRCARDAGVILSGEYVGSEKSPDEGLCQVGKQYPLIAVEVAVSETSKKVFEDATRWLKGSNGRTKLVMIVDIKEKISRHSTTQTADWGISINVLDEIELDDLTDHILRWHKNNGSSLVGSFQASFYLCFQNQEPRKVWEWEFSTDELEPSCFTFEGADYITTKELIPELGESDCIPLPLDDLSTSIYDSLVDFEIKRASDIALEKLEEMGKIDSKQKDKV